MPKILCATDFSEPADEAIRQAAERARADGAKLVVFHGVDAPPPYMPFFPHPVQGTTALRELQEAAARAVVTRVASVTGLEPSAFRALVGAGPAYAGVVEAAESEDVDLVVVASQGRTGLRRLLLGSVAERVVRHAHVSVLVARPSPADGPVIAATDLSDRSAPAVEAAAVEAKRRGVRLVVLHALDLAALAAAQVLATAGASPSAHELRQAVRARIAGLPGASSASDTVLSDDAPVAAVARHAEALGASLVVVGTHGRTGLRRVLVGSVAEGIVRAAPCSVLVVRARPLT